MNIYWLRWCMGLVLVLVATALRAGPYEDATAVRKAGGDVQQVLALYQQAITAGDGARAYNSLGTMYEHGLILQ